MGTIEQALPTERSRRDELMARLFSNLQIARYNELYYSRKSATMRQFSTWSGIISALTASAVLVGMLKDGSAAGSKFAFVVWQFLTGVAAVSAAIRPILGFDSKAIQFDKAAMGHGIVKERLRRLLNSLKLSDLDDSHLVREEEIESFRMALSALDDAGDDDLKEKCWKKTLTELPSEQAWNLV
jgi:hypothetical protein